MEEELKEDNGTEKWKNDSSIVVSVPWLNKTITLI